MEDEELQIDPAKARAQALQARKKAIADKKAQLLANRKAALEERKLKIEQRKQALLNRKNPVAESSDENITTIKKKSKEILEDRKKTAQAKKLENLERRKELMAEKKLKTDISVYRRKNSNTVGDMSDEEIKSILSEKALAEKSRQKRLYDAAQERKKLRQEEEDSWTYNNADKSIATSRSKQIGTEYKGSGSTTEELWEMNNKGVQQKFATFEEFDKAANEYIDNFKGFETITQNREKWSKTTGGFNPDTFNWNRASSKSEKIDPEIFKKRGYKKYSGKELRSLFDQYGYKGLIKYLKNNGGRYMISRGGGSTSTTTSGYTSYQ